MCDCPDLKCEKCDELLPIHIGDGNYPRTDLKVWCVEHIPKRKATVFILLEDAREWESLTQKKKTSDKYTIGWMCAIRLQGGKTEPDAEDVNPNLAAWYQVVIME